MTIPGIFSQRDGRWQGFLLGYNSSAPFDIYHYGCAITALSNIIWWAAGDATWTPDRVNRWLRDNQGYLPGGGLLIWAKAAALLQMFNIEYRGYTTDLGGTNGFLAPENNFALAQLTGPGFPMHFAAMPYIGMIGDSWDGRLKSVPPAYTFIGAHLYRKVTPAPVVVPELSPAPVQAPVIAPAVSVPSTEQPIEVSPAPAPEPVVVTPTPASVVVPAEPVDGSTGNGQASGPDVIVAPPVNVLEDDYQDTFVAFDEPILVHLKYDTMAIDMTGEGAPKQLIASFPLRVGGWFMDNGRKYYRGVSGGWYAVSAEDVVEDTTEDEPEPAPRTSFIADFIRDPVGALIRLIARLGS